MQRLTIVLLICYLVSSSMSSEDNTTTVKIDESPPIETIASMSKSTTTTTTSTPANIGAKNNLTENLELKKPTELPMELFWPELIDLNANTMLPRTARDTHSDWNRRQEYYGNRGGWSQRQESPSYNREDWRQRNEFGRPIERRPFGIQDYKKYYGTDRVERPQNFYRRNSEVRRVQVHRKPFRVYPVFPG